MLTGDKVKVILTGQVDFQKRELVSIESVISNVTETHYEITKTIIYKIKKEDEALIQPVTGV